MKKLLLIAACAVSVSTFCSEATDANDIETHQASTSLNSEDNAFVLLLKKEAELTEKINSLQRELIKTNSSISFYFEEQRKQIPEQTVQEAWSKLKEEPNFERETKSFFRYREKKEKSFQREYRRKIQAGQKDINLLAQLAAVCRWDMPMP